MAKDRNRRSPQNGDGRDLGGFVALPWVILDSAEYIALSHPAKSLLLEFSRQHFFDKKEGLFTNGRLLANSKTLEKRGWKSSDTLTRAKRELINSGFLFETVKGHRPNKASWYALTWFALPKRSNYDFGIQFKRFRSLINPILIPSKGLGRYITAPSSGVERCLTRPPDGPIKASSILVPMPPNGNLSRELPSTAFKADGYGCKET